MSDLDPAYPIPTNQRPPTGDELLHQLAARKAAQEELANQLAHTYQRGTVSGNGLGALAGSMGVAQQARAPGKTFTRQEVLAILRAQRAVAGNVADAEYERLLTIFSNIE